MKTPGSNIHKYRISLSTLQIYTMKSYIHIQMSQLPPFSLIWTKIPCLSTCLPCVGHYGITDSKGMLTDFDGPKNVNKSYTQSMFGPPCKYLQFDLTDDEKYAWDQGIQKAVYKYSDLQYNFFTNNCHNYAAYALNKGPLASQRWGCLKLLCKTRWMLKNIKEYKDYGINTQQQYH